MAKFICKKRMVIQLAAGYETIVNGRVVATPSRIFELKPGENDTSDKSWLARYGMTEKEVNDRIKSDQQFGIPEGITEFTAEDQEAVKIRSRKQKEADEEIKEKKRGRASKK